MERWAALGLRAALVGGAVLVVFAVLVVLPPVLFDTGMGQIGVLLPFLAALVCAVGAASLRPQVDRVVERVTHTRSTTPYSALAEAAARIRSGTPDSALPGLAEVLAEGTAAREARVWLAVSDRLVTAAVHPPRGGAAGETVPNLAVLLGGEDPERRADHVVPIVEGQTLRAVLAIRKTTAITPADQQLMRDVAGGAGLLLRGVAMNTELRDRVRRAAELAAELERSRERLATARDVERRRLVGELSQATTDRLATLRLVLDGARQDLGGAAPEPARAGSALRRAESQLDDLLDRFRRIARGVYPQVLRDQGPVGALEEVAADLDRSVRLAGAPEDRLPWEVESGIYYVAASALQWLAASTGPELEVELTHADGRLAVRIVDPRPGFAPGELRGALAGDLERLAALGGEAGLDSDDEGRLVLTASLPERLEPAVEVAREVRV
ncbi:sensor histidine kinase [Pseudonocardia sp. RS010]|uniref:sensor histidine kinase n=1 Tax=Pseudonocardia sp. RS010 TaxID=3385979 RepID=UPI0039A2503B